MEFIIQNIGWFVGVFLVILFALIGYFADKRDKKNIPVEKVENEIETVNRDLNSNVSEFKYDDIGNSSAITNSFDNSYNNIDNFNQVLDNTNSNEFGSRNVDLDIESTNFENVNSSSNVNTSNNINSSNNINNSNNIYGDVFKNIEDVNMSLEDLEKKNYNAILDSITDNHYSYNDDNEFNEQIIYSDLDTNIDVTNNVENNSTVNDTINFDNLNSDNLDNKNYNGDIQINSSEIINQDNQDNIILNENNLNNDMYSPIDSTNEIESVSSYDYFGDSNNQENVFYDNTVSNVNDEVNGPTVEQVNTINDLVEDKFEQSSDTVYNVVDKENDVIVNSNDNNVDLSSSIPELNANFNSSDMSNDLWKF